MAKGKAKAANSTRSNGKGSRTHRPTGGSAGIAVGNGGPPVPAAHARVGEPQLIVVARGGAGARAFAAGAARPLAALPAPQSNISRVLAKYGADIRPLFGVSEERIARGVNRMLPAVAAAAAIAGAVDLPSFYHVRGPRDRLDALAAELRRTDDVTAAYVKPPAALASINTMAPTPAPPPSATPDFSNRQSYLDAAPTGIDARHAWTFAGGRGAGVRVIDLEWAWQLTHEDLQANVGGVVGGTPLNDPGARNHGTAVIGVIGADENAFGVTGIAADATVSMVAFEDVTSRSIRVAADKLRPGDIMLLEIHRPGPRNNFEDRLDQSGYIAVEWWPDDFAAIQYAVNRGIIVVEAAGNGAQDLDDPLYDKPDLGFPDDWTNPFNRSNRDSGAILVGAGAPPQGTHGRDLYGPDRSRLDFSNFGAAVDAQGWGREVTTTGYGDLQGGGQHFEDVWYTDEFAGTSSASPVVVGALACVQGVLRARGLPLLTPARARDLLRNTGSPQQDHPDRPATERIGNRPDIRAILRELQVPAVPSGIVESKPTGPAVAVAELPGGARVTVTITIDGPRQPVR